MSDKSGPETELLKAALRPSQDCPDIETLSAALDRGDRQIALHAESCAFCSAELRMLKSFCDPAIPASDEGAIERITERLEARVPEIFPVERKRAPWWKTLFAGSWARPVTVALVAGVFAVVIGIQVRRASPPALDGRAADAGEAVRSQQTISILTPAGDVEAQPEAIDWKSVPGAAAYRVRLMEVDHRELWSGDSSQPHIPLPRDVQAKIAPSKTLLLEVTAFDKTGRTVAVSEVTRFRFLQPFYRP
jgi:hypothetical protein